MLCIVKFIGNAHCKLIDFIECIEVGRCAKLVYIGRFISLKIRLADVGKKIARLQWD